jgi:hypothetical protein
LILGATSDPNGKLKCAFNAAQREQMRHARLQTCALLGSTRGRKVQPTMPFWLRSATRTRLIIAVVAAVGGCKAPDGADLYRPLEGENGGTSGGGQSGSTGDSGAGGSPEGSAGSGEAQGGSLNLAGQAGMGGGVGAEDDAGVLDAAAPDAGEPDAAEPPSCVPTTEVCDGLDNDCDQQADQGATCGAGCAGFTLADNHYMFCSGALNYDDALERCDDAGFRLVQLDTPEESAGVMAAILASGLPLPPGELLVYIGASDQDDEGEWIWVGAGGFLFWRGGPIGDDGEAVGDAYVNWATIEPNNEGNEDCGALSVRGNATRQAGQWDDRACNQALPFTCEAL